MPKLPTKIAKAVSESEQVSGSFEILTPGKYLTRLFEVSPEEHKNYPDHVSVWVCSFNETHDLTGKKYPGRQFLRLNVILNTKMPPSYPKTQDKWDTFVRMAAGQMKAFFENMGFTPDSDTDEMIGEPAMLDIGIRTIQSGARMGEKVNDVRGVSPIPDTVDPSEIFTDDGAGASTDEF